MAGLYIHIPFCHSKCIYCDFYSTPRKHSINAVAKGIIEEFLCRKDEIKEPFTTIYFGGGTPSILPENTLIDIFSHLPTKAAEEITIEANPEDITDEKVDLWIDLGINRVSIGVQSLHDSILRSLGRRHNSADALKAIELLQKKGLSNISADLMYGLPGLSVDMWTDDLNRLVGTGITHLSAYCLTYHENTVLYKRWQQGKVICAEEDDIVRQFDLLRNVASNYGFEHYEISNLAKSGYRSRHNSSYWNPYSSWLGLGPSAHSFDGRIRRIDFPDILRWLNSLPAPFEIDEETELDIINDNIVTALRTLEGLDLNTMPLKYRESILKDAEKHISKGLMTLQGNRLSIKPDHWLVSDTFIREMLR